MHSVPIIFQIDSVWNLACNDINLNDRVAFTGHLNFAFLYQLKIWDNLHVLIKSDDDLSRLINILDTRLWCLTSADQTALD